MTILDIYLEVLDRETKPCKHGYTWDSLKKKCIKSETGLYPGEGDPDEEVRKRLHLKRRAASRPKK